MNPFQTGIRLPLDCGKFFERLQFEQCSIEESIARQLRLLLTTSFGESHFDPDLGCEIWEHEFEHSQVGKIWIDRMTVQMKTLLEKYEQRLEQISVKAHITEEEMRNTKDDQPLVRLQKCLHVQIRGKLALTNESFYANEKIYLSPFALD